jgi:hypothetical protein
MNERNVALMMLFKSVEHRLKIDAVTFQNSFDDWEVVPLKQNNEIIGGVLIKENELHIGYGKKPKASILPHLKQTLQKVMKKYGFAVTSVEKNKFEGLNFCKRIGFVELSHDRVKLLLRCYRSRYV